MPHRRQVAGCQRPVFSDKAVKKLFELSGGIPRLLNLLADRALLAAYSQQQALVELTHVQRAAVEILPSSTQTRQRQALPNWLWPVLALLGILLGFLLALQIVPVLRGE